MLYFYLCLHYVTHWRRTYCRPLLIHHLPACACTGKQARAHSSQNVELNAQKACKYVNFLISNYFSVCVWERERRQTTDLEAATRLAMRLTDARRRSKLCWGRSRGKEGEGWGRGEHRGSGTNPFNWPSQDLLHGITLLLAERWNVPFDCNKAAIIVSWGCWWGSTSQVHQKQWR